MKPGDRWLVRDKEERGTHRLLSSKPLLVQQENPNGEIVRRWINSYWGLTGYGKRVTQAELPRSLHLKPGDGPVLVRIIIEMVKP